MPFITEKSTKVQVEILTDIYIYFFVNARMFNNFI